MRAIIIDSETTGLTKPSFSNLSEQPHAIEYGAILVDENGEIIREISQLLNPGIPIPAESTKITGISDEMVKDAPDFRSFLPTLFEAWKTCDIVFGHNSSFDLTVLRYELARVECDWFPWTESVVDTVHEYKHRFGYNPNLQQLYQRIIGEDFEWKHRAIEDARAVYKILKKEGWWNHG